MGKGGKVNKSKSKGGGGSSNDAVAQNDDELLDAAIAENQAALNRLKIEEDTEADLESQRVRLGAERVKQEAEAAAEAERRDAEGTPLSRQEIAAKLDTMPTFCLVNAETKSFVSIRLQDEEGHGEECCPFWVEPLDAKAALAQAMKQRPEVTLGMGTIPLGRAFALSEGWAEAEGGFNFRLKAHAQVERQLRPMLTKQLEQQGLPTAQVFPIFMCEELTTDTVMPCFLSRAEMVSTWEAAMKQAGKQGGPPAQMTVLDLRILVRRMQAGGMDWSILRFVGTDRAYEAAQEGARQELERELAKEVAPEDEPPALV